MRNQVAYHYIHSYRALENALFNAARRYFLARNPAYAIKTEEITQSKKDSNYAPGFFHGETGNIRASNVLIRLQELPDDSTSSEYKNQLLLILFAIIDPISGSFGRSEWLATLVAQNVIEGTFSTLTQFGKSVASNTLTSKVFRKEIIDIAAYHSLETDNGDISTKEKCNKLFALSVILRCLYDNFGRAEKEIFISELNKIKWVLTRKNKIDITEAALCIKMR